MGGFLTKDELIEIIESAPYPSNFWHTISIVKNEEIKIQSAKEWVFISYKNIKT